VDQPCLRKVIAGEANRSSRVNVDIDEPSRRLPEKHADIHVIVTEVLSEVWLCEAEALPTTKVRTLTA
jgi:hypothetical protein